MTSVHAGVLERRWMRTFPHAQVTRLQDAGHYLQEDAHERIVAELLEFLDGLATPTVD